MRQPVTKYDRQRRGCGCCLLKIAAAFAALFFLVELLLRMLGTLGPEVPVRAAYTQSGNGIPPKITYERNSLGLRSANWNEAGGKDDGKVRILVLGASAVECAAQESRDTWYAKLQPQIDRHFVERGLEAEIGGYGRGGDKLHEIYAFADRSLEDLEPDIVVVMLGVNDMLAADALRPYTAAQLLDWVERERYLHRRVFPVEKSTAAGWTPQIVKRFRAWRAMADDGESPNPALAHLPEARAKYLSLPVDRGIKARVGRSAPFEELFDSFLNFLTKSGARVVVVGQPVLLKAEMAEAELAACWMPVLAPPANSAAQPEQRRLLPADFLAELRRFQAIQKAAALKHGAAYIPLEERVAPTLANFYDDAHFTDQGNDAVSLALAPDLIKVIEEWLLVKDKEE